MKIFKEIIFGLIGFTFAVFGIFRLGTDLLVAILSIFIGLAIIACTFKECKC